MKKTVGPRHSGKYQNLMHLIDIEKMSQEEGIPRSKIMAAFKNTEGPPKNGKKHRDIQKILAKKDPKKIREIYNKETHKATQYMLLRNLAKVKYLATA
jgi:hypothetical protein